MADCMMFPYNWEGFLGDYSFLDHREFYTNGARLIPTFRVEQMVEHYFATDNNVGSKWIPVSERLPDTFGSFVVAVRIPTRKRTYSDCADFDPFAKKWTPSLYWGKGMNVTHWMPLPEPPKEE